MNLVGASRDINLLENDTNYCYLWAHYSDPDTIGNCTSISTKTINSNYLEDPMDLNNDSVYYSAPFFKNVLEKYE